MPTSPGTLLGLRLCASYLCILIVSVSFMCVFIPLCLYDAFSLKLSTTAGLYSLSSLPCRSQSFEGWG